MDTKHFYIKVMKRVKINVSIVSILLIAIFTATIASEGLQLHDHACDGQSISQHHQDQRTSDSHECNDPCHAGQCHFGHCSHVYLSETNNIVAPSLSVPLHGAELLTLAHEYLSQLSRPPRIS